MNFPSFQRIAQVISFTAKRLSQQCGAPSIGNVATYGFMWIARRSVGFTLDMWCLYIKYVDLRLVFQLCFRATEILGDAETLKSSGYLSIDITIIYISYIKTFYPHILRISPYYSPLYPHSHFLMSVQRCFFGRGNHQHCCAGQQAGFQGGIEGLIHPKVVTVNTKNNGSFEAICI